MSRASAALKRKLAEAKGWTFHRVTPDPDVLPRRSPFWRAMRDGVIASPCSAPTLGETVENALKFDDRWNVA